MTEHVPVAEFTIPGEPVSKERPRFGRGRAYTPARTLLHEQKVIDAYDLACPLLEPLTGRVAIRIHFHNGNRRRRDLDNMTKLILDALNGVAYVDDHQVDRITATKQYAPGNPHTHVTITALTDGEAVA